MAKPHGGEDDEEYDEDGETHGIFIEKFNKNN